MRTIVKRVAGEETFGPHFGLPSIHHERSGMGE